MERGSNAAIAVFVKTPGLSPIKTRLAATVGKQAAERFYELCLNAIEAVIDHASKQFALERSSRIELWCSRLGCTRPVGPAEVEPSSRSAGETPAPQSGLASSPLIPFWAVAESNGIIDHRWRNFERIAQGQGTLGERLDRVYRELRQRHHAVLFIGADAPLITCDLLRKALLALADDETPFALSRAGDGGYSLFAGRVDLPTRIWTSVPYSRAETAAMFAKALRPFGFVAELPPLDDVDTADDLFRLSNHAEVTSLLPEQQAVIAFARSLLDRLPTSVDKG